MSPAKQLVQRWFDEVWNQNRREMIAEMLLPSSVIHEGDVSVTGPEGFFPFYDRLLSAFSDHQLTVESLIEENGTVCARWSVTMKHTGDSLGMPATNKQLHTTGMSFIKVEGGKLVEGWQNWDMLGLLQQINEGPQARTYLTAANA